MPLIDIDGITTIFGPHPERALELLSSGVSKSEVLARTGNAVGVHDITLAIERSEIFAVMGLSGSGKSTLVRNINRLIDPTAGTIRIDGVDVGALPRKELIELRRTQVSMVFQRFGLMPHRTVAGNVAYGLEVKGLPREARHTQALEWIERVGLAGYEDRYPSELSGGMQQRVGLARALAADTGIVLMDEAFSALDPLIRSQLQDELVALQQSTGKTIVFITHDLDEALKIAHRIAILKDGRLIQVGTPADILLRPTDEYVRAFVRDVNRARVLTVETLMRPPGLRLTSQSIDAALRAMAQAGQAFGYVIDEGRFAGVVSQQALTAAKKAPGADPALSEIATDMHAVVGPGQAIEDAVPVLLDASHPVPVIDADGRLKGVVDQQDVGALLSGEAPRPVSPSD